MRQQRTKDTLSRARDFSIYVAVGVLFWCVTLLWVRHLARTNQPIEPTIKWFHFAVITIVAFGYAIKAQRHNWGRSRLWGLVILLAVAQCAAGLLVVPRMERLSVIYVVLGGIAESVVITVVLDYFLRQHSTDRHLWSKR